MRSLRALIVQESLPVSSTPVVSLDLPLIEDCIREEQMQEWRAGGAKLPCQLVHCFVLLKFYTMSVSVTDTEKFQSSDSACGSIQKFRCLSEPHLNYTE